MPSFHERLRNLRKRLRLTQTEMARQLGIQSATYKNYEAGRREPDFAFLRQLVASYGITTDSLIVGDAPPHPLDELILYLRSNPITDDDIQLIFDLLEARRKRRK